MFQAGDCDLNLKFSVTLCATFDSPLPNRGAETPHTIDLETAICVLRLVVFLCSPAISAAHAKTRLFAYSTISSATSRFSDNIPPKLSLRTNTRLSPHLFYHLVYSTCTSSRAHTHTLSRSGWAGLLLSAQAFKHSSAHRLHLLLLWSSTLRPQVSRPGIRFRRQRVKVRKNVALVYFLVLRCQAFRAEGASSAFNSSLGLCYCVTGRCCTLPGSLSPISHVPLVLRHPPTSRALANS
jgi:hypothetical protein